MRSTRQVPTYACAADKYGRQAKTKEYRSNAGMSGDDSVEPAHDLWGTVPPSLDISQQSNVTSPERVGSPGFVQISPTSTSSPKESENRPNSDLSGSNPQQQNLDGNPGAPFYSEGQDTSLSDVTETDEEQPDGGDLESSSLEDSRDGQAGENGTTITVLDSSNEDAPVVVQDSSDDEDAAQAPNQDPFKTPLRQEGDNSARAMSVRPNKNNQQNVYALKIALTSMKTLESKDTIKFPYTLLYKNIPIVDGDFSVAILHYNSSHQKMPPYVLYMTKSNESETWDENIKISWLLYYSNNTPLPFPVPTFYNNNKEDPNFLFFFEGPQSKVAYMHFKRQKLVRLREETGADKDFAVQYQTRQINNRSQAPITLMLNAAKLEYLYDDKNFQRAFEATLETNLALRLDSLDPKKSSYEGYDLDETSSEKLDKLTEKLLRAYLYIKDTLKEEGKSYKESLQFPLNKRRTIFCFGTAAKPIGTDYGTDYVHTNVLCKLELDEWDGIEDKKNPFPKMFDARTTPLCSVNYLFPLKDDESFDYRRSGVIDGLFYNNAKDVKYRKLSVDAKFIDARNMLFPLKQPQYDDSASAGASTESRFVHNIHMLTPLQTAHRLVAIFDSEP